MVNCVRVCVCVCVLCVCVCVCMCVYVCVCVCMCVCVHASTHQHSTQYLCVFMCTQDQASNFGFTCSSNILLYANFHLAEAEGGGVVEEGSLQNRSQL